MSSAVLIMPLGDSITEGFSDVEGFSAETSDGGYRGPLFRMLVDAGFPIAFVGTADPVKDRPYGNWEGHGGWHATQIKDGISGFLVASRPDVVLLHIGT